MQRLKELRSRFHSVRRVVGNSLDFARECRVRERKALSITGKSKFVKDGYNCGINWGRKLDEEREKKRAK